MLDVYDFMIVFAFMDFQTKRVWLTIITYTHNFNY